MKENKKIKSVKLAKDYRHTRIEVLKGMKLHLSGDKWITNDYDLWFFKSEITENKTGLFEIEYEEEDEHFEYQEKLYSADKNFVDAVINADNLKNKNFLNALADWCDEKYPALVVDIIIGYNNYEEMLAMTEAFRHYCFGTIKLNNYESASLFISELNRKENETVREYYIELLKSGRLK